MSFFIHSNNIICTLSEKITLSFVLIIEPLQLNHPLKDSRKWAILEHALHRFNTVLVLGSTIPAWFNRSQTMLHRIRELKDVTTSWSEWYYEHYKLIKKSSLPPVKVKIFQKLHNIVQIKVLKEKPTYLLLIVILNLQKSSKKEHWEFWLQE